MLTFQISGIPGGYTWPDGTNIGPFLNWGPGQPDNQLVSIGYYVPVCSEWEVYQCFPLLKCF